MISDRFWRFVPMTVVVAMTSVVLAGELLNPHRRLVKTSVMLAALVIMLRFEMVYSLYFFVFLFPFPSGVLVTSTNVILMTLLTLLWAVRAASARTRLFARTEIDWLIVLFLAAYVVSFFNIESTAGIGEGTKMLWRQITAFAFFYLIVTFVTDETKLEGIIKVVCLSAGFLVFTALVEIVAPGTTIIPGWLTTAQNLGKGKLGYRLEGLRVGGSLASHGLLSDYCTITLFFMVMNFLRAKNPVEKLLWLGVTISTFIVLLATANRGAFFSFVIGLVYFLFVFRKRLTLGKYAVIIAAVVVLFFGVELILEKYTVAASITKRALGTEFVGVVPDSRVGAWEPPLRKSLEHIFIGHGPYYGIGPGLARMLWPHNAYIYYLYTLGILGLGAFLAIIYKLMRITLRHGSPRPRGSFAGTVMGLLHIQLVMFLFEQTRTDHQRNTDFVYIYIVWLLFGLIVATGKILKARAAQSLGAASPVEPAPTGRIVRPGMRGDTRENGAHLAR